VTTVTELKRQAHRIRQRPFGKSTRRASDRPARLTRGAKGESSPAFTPPTGMSLFVAVRPHRGRRQAARGVVAAARRQGGEAVESLVLPGGVEAVRTARQAPVAVVRGPVLPSAQSIDDRPQAARVCARTTRSPPSCIPAIQSGNWDKDLGPGQPHLFGLDPAAEKPAPIDLTTRAGKRVTGRRLRTSVPTADS